jgi:hypothetical protein
MLFAAVANLAFSAPSAVPHLKIHPGFNPGPSFPLRTSPFHWMLKTPCRAFFDRPVFGGALFGCWLQRYAVTRARLCRHLAALVLHSDSASRFTRIPPAVFRFIRPSSQRVDFQFLKMPIHGQLVRS